MASYVLYPPIIDSQMKAFIGADCDVYYSLSKFNSRDDFDSVQISVVEQITNKNYVNPVDSADGSTVQMRYRATGIILNVPIEKVGDNLYKSTIRGNDVSPDGGSTLGWQIGKTYKVQLRFTSRQAASISKDTNQAEWLNENANLFSEWSTVCIIKATSKIDYRIPQLKIDTTDPNQDPTSSSNFKTFDFSTLDIIGTFIRDENRKIINQNGEEESVKYDPSEYIKYYRFILYDNNSENKDVIEDSGLIYTENNEQNIDQIKYVFKTEFVKGKTYALSFYFKTEHGYTDGFYLAEDEDGPIDHRLIFEVSYVTTDEDRINYVTVENMYDYKDGVKNHTKVHTHYERYDHNRTTDNSFERTSTSEGNIGEGKNSVIDVLEDTSSHPANPILTLSTIDEEEDEGRIGIKLYSNEITEDFSGNICLRRSDSRTNFKIWTDILIYVCNQEKINEIPVIYDYTIESGVFYKYIIQLIDKDGHRTRTKDTTIEQKPALLRNFNYSFLLGKNNQQLKLKFDNTMPNYKYQVIESKIDPISSTYPIVTRNAATRYRTFPINGLISFNMDEASVFTNREKIYGSTNIAGLYDTYNKNNNIKQYDYIYEKDFRQKVLDFLYDGEFKLFKSPTEGNIIVRLMDINCVPVQSLDRLVYNFSATAYEMAEATMENLLKYGFYNPGTYATEFITYSTNIGQIQMDIPFKNGESGETVLTDIITKIYDKYDSHGRNQGGYIKRLSDIYCLKITFDSKPMKVENFSGTKISTEDNNTITEKNFTLGYNFQFNKVPTITVHYPNNMYEFDERIHFSQKNGDKLYILPDAEGKQDSVSVTVDFLYTLESETYLGHRVEEQEVKIKLGEFFEDCMPDKDIYGEILYEYNIDWFTKIHRNFRHIENIESIEIEANPGTLIWIADSSEPKHSLGEIFEIGPTGKLRLNELSSIHGITYSGVRKPDGSVDKTVHQDILVKYTAIIVEGIYKEEQDEETPNE